MRRSLVIMQEKQHRDGPKWKVRSSFWDRQPRRWSRITGQKREIFAAGDEEAGEQTKASVCLDWRYAKRDAWRGNRSILSRYLQEQLGMCLERGDQAMLFLNRRGYAGFVACRSCGTVIGCPHCNVSLSLHKKGTAGRKLVCHYCGYTQPNPRLCPSCGSPFIGSFHVGTQQVVSQVQRMFPKARILRMDADTNQRERRTSKI